MGFQYTFRGFDIPSWDLSARDLVENRDRELELYTTTIDTSFLNLNATNLTSGTVPSARISGAYTGITGVGTLASGLTVTGTVTATTFAGSGASLTSIPNTATTATSSNNASSIVARSATGNFTAADITANNFLGNATSATTSTTQTAGNSTTAIATTAFVTTADNLKQNLPVGVGWPPTLASGSWTLITWTGRYVQVNKLVQFWILGTAYGACVLGTGFNIPVLNFPVAAQSANAGGSFGTTILDSSASQLYSGITASSSVGIRPMCQATVGSYIAQAQLATTAPMTWASGDTIFIQGSYEAA